MEPNETTLISGQIVAEFEDDARKPCAAEMETSVRYDLSEHRHRFAVWAAARASQRGFTTVDILREALHATDIRTKMSIQNFFQVGPTEFERLHRQWCASICFLLKERLLKEPQSEKVTYGRAAKLVAVYLKAMVILGTGADIPLGHCIHPPIDRILLQKLAMSPRIKSDHAATWRTTNWTQLNESAYYELIAQLRAVVPGDMPFWMIEEYWTPTKEDF